MIYPKQKNRTRQQRTALASAMAVALGSSLLHTQIAVADIYTYDTTVIFRMLDPNGAGLENSSQPNGKTGNNFQTPTTGTLTIDTIAGAGSATIAPFQFFSGNSTLPATATGITFIEATSDVLNTTGNRLLLANMLFNWNGSFNIPVSLVWDASGLFGNLSTTLGSTISGVGSVGAADGTYVGLGQANKSGVDAAGYLALGPAPLATLEFNTTLSTACTTTPSCGSSGPGLTVGDGNGVAINGQLPLVNDTATNGNEFLQGDGTGIGGNPMAAGPFGGFGANFDITSLTLTSFQDTTSPLTTLSSNNVSINQGDAFDPLNPGVTVTVVDAIDGTLSLTTDCTITNPVDINTPATYQVIYDCQDFSGNANSGAGAVNPVATLNVTVQGGGAPAITLSGANPLTWEAATPFVDPGATCIDNNGAGANIPLGTNFSLDTSALNVNTLGTQTVTWNCTGASAASSLPRSVNVQDTTAPVITLTPVCDASANIITNVADGTDPTPAASAIDPNYNTNLTTSITLTGDTVDPNPAFTGISQTFNIAFDVTDAAGNKTIQACQIVQVNPKPVATLNGLATAVVTSGQGFNDPGASCQDFTDGALPDATPDIVITTSTPDNPSLIITYTCGPNSRGNTSTVTREVIIGVAFSASSTSGSNFSMPDPVGNYVGGAPDIFFSWDGSLYTSEADAAAGGANMFMGSALPTPFFGFPWVAHNITAFGPGSYQFTTSRGNPQSLFIGENQIGAHMLFDWNGNDNIDVVLTWDLNQIYTGTLDNNNDLGAKGAVFTLATVDTINIDGSPGDGIPGNKMADGPFAGFSPDFNIKMTPSFTLPDVSVDVSQGVTPVSHSITVTAPATLTATVNPDVNGVYTYAGPFTYDWSTSDTALLAAGVNTNGTSSADGTFTIDPSTLPAGSSVTARVKVKDGATKLTTTIEVPLRIVADAASAADTDGDGIPDAQDGIDNTQTPNMQQTISGAANGTSFVIESSAGKLIVGDVAAKGGASGVYQVGVSASDIGTVDNDVAGSCIGGCFSFDITSLAQGTSVDVVLPLSEGIPDNAGYRKLINGAWRDFVTTGNNAIASAAGSTGNCPAPTASGWNAGLNLGDLCVKLTIVDGGPNDADALANGVIKDPGGVSGAAIGGGQIVPGSVDSPSTGGGCTLNQTPVTANTHMEWWLLGGLLGWLGFSSRRKNH